MRVPAISENPGIPLQSVATPYIYSKGSAHAADPIYKKYGKIRFLTFFEVFPTWRPFLFFPVFPEFATSFVNTASTRRIDPHQPEASNSKNKISKCSILVYLSDTILSSRPFHRHSISPSTVSPNYGTHLDFAATPYNIDIFLKENILTSS